MTKLIGSMEGNPLPAVIAILIAMIVLAAWYVYETIKEWRK